MSKNKPVHEIRMGRVRAGIWQNETETGVRYNVTFTMLYKPGAPEVYHTKAPGR